VLERLERMLEGGISNVVAGMTRMATVRALSAKDRKPVDTAARYLLKRKGMMRYQQLLAMGAPDSDRHHRGCVPSLDQRPNGPDGSEVASAERGGCAAVAVDRVERGLR